MSRTRSVFALEIAILVTSFPVVALAQDDNCRAITDGLVRLATTPNHQFMTQHTGKQVSQIQHSELINTGTTMYLMFNGAWRLSPLTPEMMAQQAAENQNTNKTSCQLLRTESIDGIEASVYAVRSDAPESHSSGTVWIAKANGSPLRQQIDMRSEASSEEMHMETKFVYSGIAAPIVTASHVGSRP